ncbi:MAG TPA: glycosyltransferase family 4 protein [Candidatus Angelobacter sp.]|jgi:glycosyltransferase involved in cell wall biosynthesis
MKVLHVMPEFPNPPDAGGRADMWNRLRVMCGLGYGIDVLVMDQKRVPEERHVADMRHLVNTLQFVPRRPLRRCIATIVPTTSARNGTLADLCLDKQYDITLAEGENACSIFDNPTLRTKARVLRVHNNESRYMWLNAETEEGFFMRQFCRLEALRFVLFSRSVYRRVDSLWFISKSELQKFVASHSASAAKAVWLPPSIILGDEPERCAAHCKRVLFVASLNNSLNREGLRWYLNEVHTSLTQDSDYELVVAGSTSGRASAHHFVKEVQEQRRCSVHIDVDDLTALYNGCAVFINPMQRGTGLKMKNIHALGRRVPVVTTSVGNEGSGFLDKEHVRVADTPAAFASAIRELLNDEFSRVQMAARAHEFLTKYYNSEANLQRLLKNLLPESACSGDERCPPGSTKSGMEPHNRGVTRTLWQENNL